MCLNRNCLNVLSVCFVFREKMLISHDEAFEEQVKLFQKRWNSFVIKEDPDSVFDDQWDRIQMVCSFADDGVPVTTLQPWRLPDCRKKHKHSITLTFTCPWFLSEGPPSIEDYDTVKMVTVDWDAPWKKVVLINPDMGLDLLENDPDNTEQFFKMFSYMYNEADTGDCPDFYESVVPEFFNKPTFVNEKNGVAFYSVVIKLNMYYHERVFYGM